MKLKEWLIQKLPKEVLDKITFSYDIIGDIAIINLNKKAVRYEKIIAEGILATNKNIKTVLRKVKQFSGIYRVAKYKCIGGKDKRITTYKENNVKMYIDIDHVYFSTRLSNERKRIAQLIKDDEKVLVMFSGIAPYPLVIAKNTNARFIYGIEINPFAHRLGLKNIELNSIKNVFLINDDVKNCINNFLLHIIGVRGRVNSKQLKLKMKSWRKFGVKKPIVEVIIPPKILYSPRLMKRIKWLNKRSSLLFIQQSTETHKEYIINNNEELRSFLHDYNKQLETTTKELKLIINLMNKETKIVGYIISLPIVVIKLKDRKTREDISDMFSNMLIRKIRDLFKALSTKERRLVKERVFFENAPLGLFAELDYVSSLAKQLNIKNLCFNITNYISAYISKNKCANNSFSMDRINRIIEQLIKDIKSIRYKEFKVYFHIMDLGKSSLSLDRKLCQIEKYLFSKNNKALSSLFDAISYGVLCSDKLAVLKKNTNFLVKTLKPSFDRIIMPLPKGADLFLDYALDLSHKGTVIHLYLFRKENEKIKTKEEIEDHIKHRGYNGVVTNIVRCGDFSSEIHRYCYDIIIR